MKISKQYIGHESKNIANYSENTYEELKAELAAIAASWTKNGGIIIYEDSETLHVSEGSGDGEIMFQIVD